MTLSYFGMDSATCSTLATLSAGLCGLMVLFRTCQPFSKLRMAVMALMTAGFCLAPFVLGELFFLNVKTMGTQAWLIQGGLTVLSALVIALTSLTYILCGVTGVTNQISALENEAAKGLITEAQKLASIDQVIAAVRPAQTSGLFLCMTLLPFALMFLSYVLYQKKYTLDEPEYERICAELEARKGA
jgi:uncharacterized membrane protein YuzA (DUF378 family)